MKKTLIRIMAMVFVVLLAVSVTGCRKNPTSYSYYLSEDYVVEGTGTNKNDKNDKTDKTDGTSSAGKQDSSSKVQGTTSAVKDKEGRTIVKVAVSTWRPTDYAPLFDALAKKYPKIKVQLDYYSDPNSQQYIVAKSAIGQLPDVVFDDIANISLYVGQGLVYPITKYVNADPEYKYVPASIMSDYTFGGDVFALPHQAYFTCLTLNTDILDALNVDIPKLDWNFNDMVEFAKKVSNDEYLFCERLNYLDYYASGSFSKDASLCGYNIKTRKYEMTNSFAKAWKVFQELRKTPNVEGYALKLANKYQSRYGSTADWTAFKLGKAVVMDFEKGTYSFNGDNGYKDVIKGTNWVFHPYPQEFKGRMPVHIDHAFMLADTKVPDEAFKVLSFLTYSAEGNTARINAYTDKAKGKTKYNLNLDYYTPLTTHPDVVAAIKKLYADDEVQMYFYNNIANCFRGDLDKFVPHWGQHWADSINPTSMKVQDGAKDPDATAKDLQSKATSSLAEYWKDFDKQLAEFQKKWKASH